MRVRFAPSPTGALHIGGARTALFNWLLARGTGGALVLRIEDTDRERSTPENVRQILDALEWLELDWDEGPIFQTERAERHREVLERLLADGHAYRSTATAEDVKEYKRRHGAERGFRGDRSKIGQQAGDQKEGAVRLRVPEEGATVVHDVIRGDTRFEHIHLDDPVIARSDGSVLYNFAVAVDDLDAGITHVVRGDDHLSNTPKQLLVLEAAKAAGIAPEAALPLYAHLPLLHGPDGKKLSKRHGAASVQELRTAGYLPEAVRNYLALLGWGSGDDTTILATEQLVERFALQRVSRNPAQFDEAKLRWMNGVYVRELPPAELARRIAGFVELEGPAQARDLDFERLRRAAEISQEKIQVLAEFWPLAGLFFEPPAAIEEKAGQRWLDEKGRRTLAEARAELQQLPAFDQPAVESALLDVQKRLELKPRDVYQPLRVAVSGTTISPGIFETVALLGREETLQRIDVVLNWLEPKK
ncbi:MAG TPA: glutamate--tRNA ligase [Solirubrobacteraceae bacterium]|jgi:glutamyl-tRNA synthetase|nr:glutamate--tRNA ligase [Solirubrobacteraceae bacterium]